MYYMRVVIVEGKGEVLGMNLARPIVTKGDLLRSCVKVRAAIELSLKEVSGVGQGMGV